VGQAARRCRGTIPGFLLGVLLHPARDGAGIAAVGQVYGISHGLEAISLLLLAVNLVSAYVLDAQRFGRRGLSAFLTAVVGTLLWFGLIAVDGTRNPVRPAMHPTLCILPPIWTRALRSSRYQRCCCSPWGICCSCCCSPGTE
jgi:hypothetical protein